MNFACIFKIASPTDRSRQLAVVVAVNYQACGRRVCAVTDIVNLRTLVDTCRCLEFLPL